MPCIAETLREADRLLLDVSDTPRLDAELLMAKALGVSRSEMLVRHQDAPAPASFRSLLERRLAAEPVAYILGHCAFFGLELAVTPGVLIPRSDSESVVEAALEVFPDEGTVLDLGAGSGALLLAILSQRPGLTGLGIDASEAALVVARANARSTGLAERARFLRRDWRDAGWAADLGRHDGVIANPPYVEADARLDRSVREFEPAEALFAGTDGLEAYRALLPQLRGLMACGARAVVEIGSSQAKPVSDLAENAGFEVDVRRDLAKRTRALVLS